MKKVVHITSGYEMIDNKSITKEYFIKQGFRLVEESNNQIVFRKGGIFRNLIAMSPLNWKSIATISFHSHSINSYFIINTFGQIVTPNEEKIWDNFISNYKQSLIDHKNYHTQNHQQIMKAQKNNLKLILWAVVIGILVGIPSGIIGYYFGLSLKVSAIIASAIAIILIFIKINRDISKESKSNV